MPECVSEWSEQSAKAYAPSMPQVKWTTADSELDMLGVLKGVKDTMNVLKKALEHTREQIEQLEQENSPELPMT